MLRTSPIVTTIRCADPRKQGMFYGEVLGLREVERGDKGAVTFEAGAGTRLALYAGEPSRADHTLLTFEVRNIETCVRALERRGVTFEDYDLPGFRTEGHIVTDAGHRCAWFRDPEGNYLGLSQPL